MSHRGYWWGSALGALALLVCAWPASGQGISDELQDQINKAVENGVKYLKGRQSPQNGLWPTRLVAFTSGAQALIGWSLLESGVPASDPVIQNAARFLRESAVSEKKVYNLSLSIFFFDKLGDPDDIPIIESLAVRLLDAQSKDGGWTYDNFHKYENGECVPADYQAWLRQAIANRKGGGPRAKLPRTWKDLAPLTQRECRRIYDSQPRNTLAGGDNSNTQFAMIALWVARKYGVPVGFYLRRTGARFVQTQMPDGSWSYENTNTPFLPADKHTPAMTCAGLLGLWLAAATDPRIPPNQVKAWLKQQRQVQGGMQHLDSVIRNMQVPDKKHYYFLWSLERVGMGYDTKLINTVEWYPWAARWLVNEQKKGRNGAFPGGEYDDCDSAFALLVLKRVNVLDLPPQNLNIGEVIIAKDKKGPKVKPKDDDLPPIDLTPVVPKDESKKGGSGGKSNGSGGRSSWLARPRPEPLAWQSPPRHAPLGEGCRLGKRS